MAHNSYKMNDVEKTFGGIQEYMYCKKWFLDYINEILPMGEGSSSAMPYHFTHYVWETCTDKNMWKYQYEDRYSPLKLQMCIKTIRKCTFHMPCYSWQMNFVEKICIGGIEHNMYCKKYLWSISVKCLPLGVHLPCHVTSPVIYAKHCSFK